MNLKAAFAVVAFLVQLVAWLERIKAIKAAEADVFRRLLAAARSEADAITQEFDSAARRADADSLFRDPFERP